MHTGYHCKRLYISYLTHIQLSLLHEYAIQFNVYIQLQPSSAKVHSTLRSVAQQPLMHSMSIHVIIIPTVKPNSQTEPLSLLSVRAVTDQQTGAWAKTTGINKIQPSRKPTKMKVVWDTTSVPTGVLKLRKDRVRVTYYLPYQFI